eukprot:TRINITY_DN10438_c0_g1_i1.p1 TRINITY_DN10438_c0_g1~~TRINITY_DN10438_c0_g1_i1.p1  ORF type:complete len:149 (-),score=1.44 TRINITY_DN10438_c0_g1_i1:306-752(-)
MRRLQLAFQLAEAIEYIHSRGLVHRDIRCDNVLLDASNNILLGDFGICIQRVHAVESVPSHPGYHADVVTEGGMYDVWSALNMKAHSLFTLSATSAIDSAFFGIILQPRLAVESQAYQRLVAACGKNAPFTWIRATLACMMHDPARPM